MIGSRVWRMRKILRIHADTMIIFLFIFIDLFKIDSSSWKIVSKRMEKYWFKEKLPREVKKKNEVNEVEGDALMENPAMFQIITDAQRQKKWMKCTGQVEELSWRREKNKPTNKTESFH